MAEQLDDVLQELGLSQYLDAFVDQGFDTWDTILDITESDLDALNVKLGHRRKLQRRIANYRGIGPDVALASPTRPTVEEVPRHESITKQEPSAFSLDNRGAVPGVLAKRKYRRHPKADASAPERPPSAYVLFSNKMREELKGRNLSFTEIAKLVGENWQGLSPEEREPFETQAQAAKDKYNHDLAEYKKTPEYKKYMAYLQEFKAKHANQTQEKDAFKRIRLSDFGNSSSQSSTDVDSVTPPAVGQQQQQQQQQHHHQHQQKQQQQQHQQERVAMRRSRRSGSESQHENEAYPLRRHGERRVGSTVSASDSYYSASASASPTPIAHRGSFSESLRSPTQQSVADHNGDRVDHRSPPVQVSMSPRDTALHHASRHSDAPSYNGSSHGHSHGHDRDDSHRRDHNHGHGHGYGHGRDHSHDHSHGNATGNRVSLPPLSDMFDNRQLSPTGMQPNAIAEARASSGSGSNSSNCSINGGHSGGGGSGGSSSNYVNGATAAASTANSPGLPPPSMTTSVSTASSGSSSSSSYTSSYPRTPLEGSLPIHALLSGKTTSPTSPPPLTALPPRHHLSPRNQPSPHRPSASPPPSRHMSLPEPRHSPTSWSYPGQGTVDHQATYAERAPSTAMRQTGNGPYPFRS